MSNPPSQPILESKLQAPRPRPGGLPRPALLAALGRAAQSRIVLLQAPAGYGKSHLLAQWVAAAPEDRLWLALDAEDDRTEALLGLLIAALGKRQPGFGAQAAGLLGGGDWRGAAALLVNALAELPECWLVLDDVHQLSPAGALPALETLLEHAPPSLHFLLSSRTRPALPLARWAAGGDLAQIGPQELLLDAREARAFLSDVLGLALEEEQYRSLHANTEGWVAGLQLAGLAAQRRQDARTRHEDAEYLEAYRGEQASLFAYFAAEVFDQQPPAIQRFLLRTAIPQQFDRQLAAALTGDQAAGRTLEQVAQAGLFLIALDAEGRWYRYHHLMRDFLRRELEQRHPGDLAAVQRLTAEHFAGLGEIESAIEHGLRAGAHAWVAQQLAAHIDRMYTLRDMQLIHDWTAALPEEVMAQHPRLQLFQAWALVMLGHLQAAEAQLPDLKAASNGDEGELGGILAVIEATLAVQQGRPGAIAHYRAAEQALPASALNWRGAVYLGLLMGHYLGDGDLAAAVDAGQRSLPANQQAYNDFGFHYSAYYLGQAQIALGQLKSAEATCRHALEAAQQPDGSPGLLAAWGHLGLGHCAFLRTRAEDATQHLVEAVRLGKTSRNKEILVRASLLLAQLAAAAGDWNQMDELLTQAEGAALQIGIPDMRPLLEAGRQELNLLAGRHALVGDFHAAPSPAYLDRSALLAARLALAVGNRSTATEALTAHLDRLPPDALSARLEANLWLALAMADDQAAAPYLQTALDLGAASGILQPFIAAGDPARALIAKLDPGHALARQLDWGAFQQPRQAGAALIEPLSASELALLALMARGLTNQQLAAERHLSLNTVKWHLKNIYGKLGVSNRTAAVHRAKELALI